MLLEHSVEADIGTINKNPYSGPILGKLPHFQRVLAALSRPRAYDDFQRRARGYGLCDFNHREAPRVERTRAAVQPVQRRRPQPFVIQHGDARQDNVFFADAADGAAARAVLIDWQAVIPIHPGKDIAWTLMDMDSAVVEESGVLEAIVEAYLQGRRAGRRLVVSSDDEIGAVTSAEVISWLPLGVLGCVLVWTAVLRHVFQKGFDPNSAASKLIVGYLPRLDRMAEVHCAAELARLESL
jgi:hypothetical protein